MTEESTEFTPDWVSPPGDSIREILEYFDKTEEELALDMGKDPVEVLEVLLGRSPLTEEFAKLLCKSFEYFERATNSEVTRGTVDPNFWLRREEQFRAGVKRLGKEAEYAPTIPCEGPLEVVEYAQVCTKCGEEDWSPDDDLPFRARHYKADSVCYKGRNGRCVVNSHAGRDCKKPASEA